MSDARSVVGQSRGRQLTMAEGLDALRALRTAERDLAEEARNEAQTRFDVIDSLITECFGWGDTSDRRVKVEAFQHGEFTDYELGSPRAVIWEAKREGVTFELPPGSAKRPIQDIPSLLARCRNARAAIEQVQGYCTKRGVELAIVTNGKQLICFLASRGDGVAPFDGDCFVVDSLDQLESRFVTAWDLLSPDGCAEKRYLRILKHGAEVSVPAKLSTYLREYPKQRSLTDLQANLRTLAELLLQDIGETEAEEERFYERCYCQSGALSQHSLLNKKLLEARYASLAESTDINARIDAASPKGKERGTITSDVLNEALSRRPVILIGDIGVGKTSFLKNLMYRDAKAVFDNAIYIFANLGQRGTLNPDIRKVILDEAESQLLKRYNIDIREASFLKGAYASEIERFKRGPFKDLFQSDQKSLDAALPQFLHDLSNRGAEHLKRAVEHLHKGRHFQVIFVLDNADQRKDEVQQEAFLIAQELAKDWACHVFISLRPDTFYRSRAAGVLAAYPHRVFTISPPRIDEFLLKRLAYALDMAEGRLPVQRIAGIKLNIQSIASAIKALIHTLQQNDELQEFLANVTGGNVRELLQFVTNFFGSPNVNAEKIVEVVSREGVYRIPLFDLSKAAILGDYAHYSAERSLALNVFDVRRPDPREHFLVLLELAFLDFDGGHRDQSGFTSANLIVDELMAHGFGESQIVDAIRRILQKRLIETPHRMLDVIEGMDAGEATLEKYRLTARGAYHLKKWVPTFAYLDAMAFDTPIFDQALSERMSSRVESFNIRDRFSRTSEFRLYLVKQWKSSGLHAAYFDLDATLKRGDYTFQTASRAAEFS